MHTSKTRKREREGERERQGEEIAEEAPVKNKLTFVDCEPSWAFGFSSNSESLLRLGLLRSLWLDEVLGGLSGRTGESSSTPGYCKELGGL